MSRMGKSIETETSHFLGLGDGKKDMGSGGGKGGD